MILGEIHTSLRERALIDALARRGDPLCFVSLQRDIWWMLVRFDEILYS